MKQSVFFAFVLLCSALGASEMEKRFRKVENKSEGKQIRNVDFIYLINLDQRPEKLALSLKELETYGIIPHRLPAVYGWGIAKEVLDDVGVKFAPGMELYQWAIQYPNRKNREREFEFLRESSFGNTFFSPCTSLGAIGCSLSHLSVLQDAYDSGYETIWVLEDDISVKATPHYLADLIDKLDELVGKEGWDVLYTDIDTQDYWIYSEKNDFQSNLRGLRMDLFWRPDLPPPNPFELTKRTIVRNDFLKIGSRMRTHSMII